MMKMYVVAFTGSPQRTTSNEYPQDMFLCRIRKLSILFVAKSTLSEAVSLRFSHNFNMNWATIMHTHICNFFMV